MKSIIKIMSLILLLGLSTSCEKEEAIVSDFNGKIPFPIIEEGTTEASKLAYQLGKEHELHLYINLEGEEGLQTESGPIKLTGLMGDLQKAEEERAVVMLKLIDEVYDLFKDHRELQVHRRWILAGNGFTSQTTRQLNNFGFNRDFLTLTWQATQVITNVNNDFEFNLPLTKEMLLYAYFSGYFEHYYSISQEFKDVSAGSYRWEILRSGEPAFFSSNPNVTEYDEERATSHGFVHPYGTFAILYNPFTDWTSYVVWIISRPKAERDVWLETIPRVKAKYDIVLAAMLGEFEMDLEVISTTWQSVGL